MNCAHDTAIDQGLTYAATVYPDLSGGFSISAVNAGPEGNQINLQIATATAANVPLQVTAEGNTIYVTPYCRSSHPRELGVVAQKLRQ